MEHVLSFFSNLILLTAGVAVLCLWITIFVVIGIEIYDAFHETPVEEEEEY